MSFFPALTSNVKDKYGTKRISVNNNTDSENPTSYVKGVPSLIPVAYYPNKVVDGLNAKNLDITKIVGNINNACSSTTHRYSGVAVVSPTSGTISIAPTIFKSTNPDLRLEIEKLSINMDDYVKDVNQIFILKEIPNILILNGYVYKGSYDSGNVDVYTHYQDKAATQSSGTFTSGGLTKPVIYAKVNIDNNNKLSNDQYNACQAVIARTRTYDVSKMTESGGFYGLKDIFVKLRSLRYVLLIILILSVYLLVNATLASADLGMNIASLIANRSSPSATFLIGALLGILIPAIISAIMARQQIESTNAKYGTYDISNSPYGEKVDINKKKESNDISLVIGLILIAFICIMIIYATLRSKSTSTSMKVGITIGMFILLTIILFLLFYWAPIVSYANDESIDKTYTIHRALKVWLKGEDQSDISELTSNLHIDRFLRRYFAIYAVIALLVAAFYIVQPSSMGTPSILEGFMASFAIIALPILWIFNWMVGIKLFVIYPMVLMMVRYLRYGLYFLLRMMYANDARMTHMKAEFDKPENYMAPWDMLGLTIFKYILKLNGGRALYSELFMDGKDGQKDITKNSYTTGHLLRVGMKSGNMLSSEHHTWTFILTILIVILLIFGVIGSKNVF